MGVVNWKDLAQNKDKWRVVVRAVTNCRVPYIKSRPFLVQRLMKDSALRR